MCVCWPAHLGRSRGMTRDKNPARIGLFIEKLFLTDIISGHWITRVRVGFKLAMEGLVLAMWANSDDPISSTGFGVQP
jgi:hypothetical protein